MARDEGRYAGLLFAVGGFLGGQMQASNIVNARSPEHGGRSGRGFSSDGVKLAECLVWFGKSPAGVEQRAVVVGTIALPSTPSTAKHP